MSIEMKRKEGERKTEQTRQQMIAFKLRVRCNKYSRGLKTHSMKLPFRSAWCDRRSFVFPFLSFTCACTISHRFPQHEIRLIAISQTKTKHIQPFLFPLTRIYSPLPICLFPSAHRANITYSPRHHSFIQNFLYVQKFTTYVLNQR